MINHVHSIILFNNRSTDLVSMYKFKKNAADYANMYKVFFFNFFSTFFGWGIYASANHIFLAGVKLMAVFVSDG